MDLLEVVARGLVQPSFARCCAAGDEFFDTFYCTLAEIGPGVGAMFANVDMKKQNTLVQRGITHLVGFAIGNPAAAVELRHLGRKHSRAELGVHPSLYDYWVTALLAAGA